MSARASALTYAKFVAKRHEVDRYWHLLCIFGDNSNDLVPDSPLPKVYGYDEYGAFNCAGEQPRGALRPRGGSFRKTDWAGERLEVVMEVVAKLTAWKAALPEKPSATCFPPSVANAAAIPFDATADHT